MEGELRGWSPVGRRSEAVLDDEAGGGGYMTPGGLLKPASA